MHIRRMYYGRIIREHRHKLGLSQEELGAKLGISRSMLSKYERDDAKPTQAVMSALERIFGIDALVGDEELDEEGKKRAELGRIIAERRRELRMSQIELADAVEVDQAAISKIERGKVEIKYLTGNRLERVLGFDHGTLAQVHDLDSTPPDSDIFSAPMQAYTLKHIGKKIYARRKELGLTQPELAQVTGMSQSGISKIERGETTPTVGNIQSIARALKTKFAAFTDDPHPIDPVLQELFESPLGAELNDIEREWLLDNQIASMQGSGGEKVTPMTYYYLAKHILPTLKK